MSSWNASGLSNEELMYHDECILVSPSDDIVGHSNKAKSHVFSVETPRGLLHRAFSVFMFDRTTNELLLQQRATDKITFPSVWTNTCCSHPLHGMSPSEVDKQEDVRKGNVPGVINAAVRKLKHELGIDCEASGIKNSDFKFLTRLHYWAVDTVTHGAKAPWGEHEIDYVLFVMVDKSTLKMTPNPEEVSGVKWVSKSSLITGMKTGLWSPWFRLIVNKWLLPTGGWWEDLSATMSTSKFCDYSNVHKFDPPEEHVGGAGNAQIPYLGSINRIDPVNKNSGLKQGGYGKVKIHKESKLSQICRLSEVFSAVTLLYIKPLTSNLSSPAIASRFDKSNLDFCDHILGKVSRSFAAVIRQLPEQLLVETMIFYLVLRALDTVEDDMTAFPSNDIKIGHLLEFHKTALGDPNWSMNGVGEADEARLLEEFPKCHNVFASLSAQSKRVIVDITQRMAAGMAEFVGKDLGQGTATIKEYNRYCHFVAGLVGEGLSRLFACSGLEKPSLAAELHLSDQMGLFLQKTNIIRDYLEDYVDGRAFWPAEIWKKHSKSGDLGYFSHQGSDEEKRRSRECLNELVTNALELVPDCLAYLGLLQCQEIFRFCAIPQVMAIATLDKVYNNLDVFTGVVKIRKGLSCQLLLNTNAKLEVKATFARFAKSIMSQSSKVDPAYDRTMKACENILEICEPEGATLPPSPIIHVLNFLAPTVLAACAYDLFKSARADKWGDNVLLPHLDDTEDVAILGIAFGCIIYLLAFGAFNIVLGNIESDAIEEEGTNKPRMSRSASVKELKPAIVLSRSNSFE